MSQESHKTEKQVTLSDILLLSRKTFLTYYLEKKDVSALIAQSNFDRLVVEGYISLQEALKTLNTPKKIDTFYLNARTDFLKSEQGRLSNIHNNTTFKASVVSGLTSGTAVGTIFCLLSPFATALIQPTADALFKRETKTVEAPKPEASPQTIIVNCGDTPHSASPISPNKAPHKKANQAPHR